MWFFCLQLDQHAALITPVAQMVDVHVRRVTLLLVVLLGLYF